MYTPIKPKFQSSARKHKISSSVSPIGVNLLSKRIVKIGELSENAYSKFYESSFFMSPEQRIKKYHSKLSSLSKILDKKFPNIKSGQLDKFVLYEHGLLQVFRVLSNVILKNKMFSFKEVEFCAVLKSKKIKILLKVANIYKRKKNGILNKYVKIWRDNLMGNKLISIKFTKTFSIAVNRNFNDLKDAFMKIALFSLKRKIQSLIHSNWLQFQKEEKMNVEEKRLRNRMSFLTLFYQLNNLFLFKRKKYLNFTFKKIYNKTTKCNRIQKTLSKFCGLIEKKVKKNAFEILDHHSRRMRMLIEIMNSFRVKILIKSFWALRHWKTLKNEEIDKFKGIIFCQKLKNLVLIKKKMGFEILRQKCKKDLKLNARKAQHPLCNLIKKKFIQRKRFIFDYIKKRIEESQENLNQKTFFLIKILDLFIKKKQKELKKHAITELKKFLER